ncbi:MAG TPA: response regulator [Clostridia bacterium]|nr:response regulator [Clostridia bacterium]
MATTVRILHLEDNPCDAELISQKLRDADPSFEIVQVTDKAGFESALKQAMFDVILSDYTLPGYDGFSALALVRQTDRHIPFILVSGALGFEGALQALNLGATDYVSKDSLCNLVPAIWAALANTAFNISMPAPASDASAWPASDQVQPNPFSDRS